MILVFLLNFAACHAVVGQELSVKWLKDSTAVSYKLVHPLHLIEATSKEVTFDMRIDTTRKEITSVSASVDVTTFDSGNSSRDSHAMEVVDAITYPDVVFKSTGVRAHGDTCSITGSLSFHGITKTIIAEILPIWSANRMHVNGYFGFTLSDFKIERPSLLMIPVKDTLTFTLKGACIW